MNLKKKNKAISILKKVYHHANADFETKYDGIVGHKTDFLTTEDWHILEEADLIPNRMRKHTHDSLIRDFLALKENKKLTFDFCKSLFLKGLTGESPRFRQTLISFVYLQFLEEHEYLYKEKYSECGVCCLPKHCTEDMTHTLFTYYIGYSSNFYPPHYLTELEDVLQYPKPEINESDKEILMNLLLFIDKAEEKESPGHLAKRIASHKMLPKTDKYKRIGILQTLAILEILPSKKELVRQSHRSEIGFPLSGWRGKLGVDFEKASEIFEITVPNN